MHFFSALALVLLTLAGYSSGTVLGGGKKKIVPGIPDLLLVVALWVLVFALRDDFGKWSAIGVGLALGIAVGGVLALLRPGAEDASVRLGHLDEAPAEAPSGILARWKRFAMKMGNFQGRMVMAFFYFSVVAPFALLSRVIGESQSAPSTPGSFWLDRPATAARLDSARTQF